MSVYRYVYRVTLCVCVCMCVCVYTHVIMCTTSFCFDTFIFMFYAIWTGARSLAAKPREKCRLEGKDHNRSQSITINHNRL